MKRCGWVVAAIGAAAVALSAQDAGTVRRVTVQGTELAWVEQGSGTPVVFVHGSGADLRTWGYQMGPVAQASFRAVAYSRRFHHPNAPPAEADAYRRLSTRPIWQHSSSPCMRARFISSPRRMEASSRCSPRGIGLP